MGNVFYCLSSRKPNNLAMIQEILTWSCVSGAFAYTLYGLGKTIKESYNKKSTGCTSSCGCCSVKKELLQNISAANLKLTPIKR